MEEVGVVKVFFGEDSPGRRFYGFAYVLDHEGNRTGEEVFFHLNAARLIQGYRDDAGHPAVGWVKKQAKLRHLGREPRRGDHIVFKQTRSDNNGPSRSALKWTFKSIWDAELRTAGRRASVT